MATQLQFRRGTTSQNDGYTGLVGELSIDTDTENIRIHDGSTAGGTEIVPAGTIVAYGAGTAPTGWLLCDDSAVSRTTYARLFAVISTTFGTGDGSSTFNLPDLRDKIPLGKGTNNASLGTTTGSVAASSVMTSASKSGVTTGTGTTGGGTTGSDGDGDLTPTNYTVDRTLSAGTKDVTQVSLITAITQAAHTHSVPGLSVPALSVNAFTVDTTLPSEVVNYIIKT